MNTIKDLSQSLAESIAERRVYNIEEVQMMIYARIKSSMKDILQEQLTIEEREYAKLLELQSAQRIGSPEYTKTGYKLSALKQKKSAINRGLQEMKKTDAHAKLKDEVARLNVECDLFRTHIFETEGQEKVLELLTVKN